MEKELTQIILENEGLIYKAAHYFNNGSNFDDLYQAGCIGIIKGYPNYDKSKNVKFSTYIYSYIIGEMKKVISENKMIKVSRDISKLRNKIYEAKNVLEQKLMKEPSILELCDFLDIDEYSLAEAINSNVTIQSIDSNLGDTNITMQEIISAPNLNIDDLLYLKTEIDMLEEPERSIMINRYYNDMTQEQIADKLGLNQVEVSRKECKVKKKIKAFN